MSTIDDNLFPLVVSEQVGDTIEVAFSPQATPAVYARRVRCLMLSGLSEQQAQQAASAPIVLELFYSVGQGCFAVESEPLDCIEIYNPFDGNEIPFETIR